MSQDEMFNIVPDFDGFHYEPNKDKARLTKQIKKIYDVISSAKCWVTVDEINAHFVSPMPENSIQAQLRNLRKEKFGGHNVVGRYRSETRIFEYRLEDK
jgi:hypothetical protein